MALSVRATCPWWLPVTPKDRFANSPNSEIDQQISLAPYPDKLELRNRL